jgi:hypothetical protein
MGLLSLKNSTPDSCFIRELYYFTWSDPVRRFGVRRAPSN